MDSILDKNEGTIDSHIQMPKCVLKHFVDEYQSFYYYDINESDSRRKIKLGRPKTLNTKKGYYSNEVERLLQKIIETPLGTEIQYMTSNDFSQPIDIPHNFRDVSLIYIHSLIARAPYLYSEIEKKSLFLQFFNNLTKTEKNDLAVTCVLQVGVENSPFKDYIITMMVNNTTIPFVLPICGMYSYGNFVCAPISCNRAIALVKKDTSLCDKLVNGKVCKVLLVENEAVMHQLNIFAIQAELNRNKQYVVSVSKDLLAKYLKELSLI